MFSVIVLLTNSAQLTPFMPIDNILYRIDKFLFLDSSNVMQWMAKHSYLKSTMVYAYASLVLQMIFLPILLCILGRFKTIAEYNCLMLLSAIIGFAIYYFLPTTAPSGLIDSPFFTQEQLDTSLKFRQIHSGLPATTLSGGLISFPSFHVIWAWFILFLIRDYKWLLYPLVGINSLIALSCVLLGWHYFTDLIGSAGVIMLTHAIYNEFKRINLATDNLYTGS